MGLAFYHRHRVIKSSFSTCQLNSNFRYLSAQEKKFTEDPSVAESLRAASEPITLRKCLEAMTREEELGEEEKYYCSECKKHQVCSS